MQARAEHPRRPLLPWLLLGLLLLFVARIGATLLLGPGSRVVPFPLQGLFAAAATYLALRCWLLPFDQRSARSMIALPALLLAILAFALWLATRLDLLLSALALRAGTWTAIRLGSTAGVVPTMVFLKLTLEGALLGAALWAAEWAASRLLALPAPPALAIAHIGGLAIAAAWASLFTTALTHLLSDGSTPPTSIAALGLISLVFALLTAIPYFALTWLAWRRRTTATAE